MPENDGNPWVLPNALSVYHSAEIVHKDSVRAHRNAIRRDNELVDTIGTLRARIDELESLVLKVRRELRTGS